MRWTRVARASVGDPLGAKTHPAIEKWAKYKEDYHLRFQWTPKTVRDVLLWGLVAPFTLYKIIVKNQVEVEKQNGRDGVHLTFWGGAKSP